MRILVVSAHPDDETFGCAGTLLVHRAQGDELFWLIATKAHPPTWNAESIQAKAHEVVSVAAAYGMQDYFWIGLPSTQLDHLPLNDIVAAFRPVFDKVQPQIVYTVHHGDIHTDHAAVFQAVSIILKPFYLRQFGVQRILSFECLSSTEAAPPVAQRAFIPNSFRDITQFLARKIEIASLYATEMQSELSPRSASAIRALARLRGATVGVEYAEAFMLIRELS